LPVPVSPWINTAEPVGATILTAFKARRIPELEPIISFSDGGRSRRARNIVVAKVAMIGCFSLSDTLR